LADNDATYAVSTFDFQGNDEDDWQQVNQDLMQAKMRFAP
jgi:hypothetical protein